MSWILIGCSVVGVWSMLTVFGGERRRQMDEIEARKQLEAQIAEQNNKTSYP